MVSSGEDGTQWVSFQLLLVRGLCRLLVGNSKSNVRGEKGGHFFGVFLLLHQKIKVK